MSATRRFPAEWEPQAALLLAWPHTRTDWRDHLETIEPVYVELVRAVTAIQPAWILCQDPLHLQSISQRLTAAGVDGTCVQLIIVAYNDTWIRDYGPLAVLEDSRPRLLDFRFDGWGGKFEAAYDDRVSAALRGAGVFAETALTALPQVLEGGSLETDGAGTLLTTSRCLLEASRNPDLDRNDWNRLFDEQFGCDRVLWLEHGYLAGDDTDGHIDTLVRFSDEHTLLYVGCNGTTHPNYDGLQRMAQQLQAIRRRDGRAYRLVALPSPQPVYDTDGRLLPASYANFIIINQRVLVPVYHDPADSAALAIISGCFPDREVIGIDTRAMIRQGGALHCASMHIPQAVVGHGEW